MNRPDNQLPTPDAGKGPQKKRGWSGKRIAGLALLCGVLAGGLGVYVIEAGSGNETLAGRCAANTDFTAAIDGAAGGEVAAMSVLDTPIDVAPLAFADEAGQPTTLGALSGRALLVNLWATWCAPCRAEMPALDELEREAGDESFAVVPISVDMGDDVKPKAFYEEIGLADLPFFHDGSMALFNGLRGEGLAFGLPVTLVVDSEGCARGVMNGPAEWAGPDALRLIEAVKAADGPAA